MISNLEEMGFMYIAEQTTPEDLKIDNMKVNDKNGVFFVEFDSCLHSFDVINRNERQYIASNIEECLQSERIQSQLADNAWYGEMDHPMQITENAKLTSNRIQNVFMENRSHKIMRPTIKDNMLFAHIQTASGTDAGRGFASEIVQGLNPAFSCRAIASMRLINGKPTVICRKIVTYDWVLFPSHKEAHITSKANGVRKSIETVTESVKDKITKVSKDIALPLKEILENVGMTDVNTQVIMESFDLNSEDLVGFNDQRTHAIITDGDNKIYAKMSPDTVKKVHDFYSSFSL